MNEQTTSTDSKMYCARHPREETGITCASCGTPICPKCMVVTPVGMKCRDCGTNTNSVLFQVGAGRLALAFMVAVFAGILASILGNFGLIVWFLSAPYGYFVGSLILKAAGMKRGMKLEITAGAGVVIGAIATHLPEVLMGGIGALVTGHSLLSLVAVVITASCAVSKIRNLW